MDSGTDGHGSGPWPTVDEAAELVDRNVRTLRRRIERGTLAHRAEKRDGREVLVVDPEGLAEDYPEVAGTIRARWGTNAGTEGHGSGHGEDSREAGQSPAGAAPEPETERVEAEQDDAEPSAQALQVAGSLALQIRAQVAGEIERAQRRADEADQRREIEVERERERTNRAERRAWIGWGSAAAVGVLAAGGLGLREVAAADREGQALEQALEAERRASLAISETREAEREKTAAQEAARLAQEETRDLRDQLEQARLRALGRAVAVHGAREALRLLGGRR